MKTAIHPKTQLIKATCACGASHTVESTLDHDIQIDVCSQCHPFYTGKQNLIDIAGRVDKFKERLAKTEQLKATAKKKPKKKPSEPKLEDLVPEADKVTA